VGANRPPTSSEQAAIVAAAQQDHPGFEVRLIRIADSDPSWAALQYQPHSGQAEGFSEIRHQIGAAWQSISYGTAQVDCGSNVPANVQADFADVLGSCPS
jgi:hypothetical protein